MRMCACRGTSGFAHVSCLAEQRRFWSRRLRRTIWTRSNRRMRGGNGGTRRFASNLPEALCARTRVGVLEDVLKPARGRLESDGFAMTVLGLGLNTRSSEALVIFRAQLATSHGRRIYMAFGLQGQLRATVGARREADDEKKTIRIYLGSTWAARLDPTRCS